MAVLPEQTPEIVGSGTQYGRAIQWVVEHIPEICLAAVTKNGLALQFIENRTPHVELVAVRRKLAGDPVCE